MMATYWLKRTKELFTRDDASVPGRGRASVAFMSPGFLDCNAALHARQRGIQFLTVAPVSHALMLALLVSKRSSQPSRLSSPHLGQLVADRHAGAVEVVAAQVDLQILVAQTARSQPAIRRPVD